MMKNAARNADRSEGSPKFNVLLLQEPENTSAERLHVARKQAITNAKFMFPRQDRMVDVKFDGASAIKSPYVLEKSAVGNHLFLWCLSH